MAHAAAPWKTFATGQAFGQYYTFADASASVTKPKGIAIRVSSPGSKNRRIEVTYSYICSSKDLKLKNGSIHVLSFKNAQLCDIDAVASLGDADSVTVQLLKRGQ